MCNMSSWRQMEQREWIELTVHSAEVITGVGEPRLTTVAEGQGPQGQTQTPHGSVLGAQPVQTLAHQLAQRLGQLLQTLLHLGNTNTGGWGR